MPQRQRLPRASCCFCRAEAWLSALVPLAWGSEREGRPAAETPTRRSAGLLVCWSAGLLAVLLALRGRRWGHWPPAAIRLPAHGLRYKLYRPQVEIACRN